MSNLTSGDRSSRIHLLTTSDEKQKTVTMSYMEYFALQINVQYLIDEIMDSTSILVIDKFQKKATEIGNLFGVNIYVKLNEITNQIEVDTYDYINISAITIEEKELLRKHGFAC